MTSWARRAVSVQCDGFGGDVVPVGPVPLVVVVVLAVVDVVDEGDVEVDVLEPDGRVVEDVAEPLLHPARSATVASTGVNVAILGRFRRSPPRVLIVDRSFHRQTSAKVQDGAVGSPGPARWRGRRRRWQMRI
jgi:hypothetical protein